VIGRQQRGLAGVPGGDAGADDEIVGFGADNVARGAVELDVDGGDDGAVFVGAGDQPAVDLADIGLMGVAADHDVDGAVEFFDDVDDGAGNAGAFIVVAGRLTAF